MEIRLNDLEIVALQEIRRGRKPVFNIDEFILSGIVTSDCRITEFGKLVLSMHEPVNSLSYIKIPGKLIKEYFDKYK